MQSYPITPVPAPRMTQSDKWKKRPCVMQYRAFRDEVRLRGVKIPETPCKITFTLEMPRTWSKKKREMMNGSAHQQTPDVDNLLKSLLDSVFEQDKKIWSVWGEKIWGNAGAIKVEDILGKMS